MVTAEQRAQIGPIVGRVYAEWAAEQDVQPDTRWADAVETQYPEHAEVMSADTEAQQDLYERTTAALLDAGIPIGPDGEKAVKMSRVGRVSWALCTNGFLSVLTAAGGQSWRDQLRIPKGNGRRSGRWTFTPWKHLDDLIGLINALGSTVPADTRQRVIDSIDVLRDFDSNDFDVHDPALAEAAATVADLLQGTESADPSLSDALRQAEIGIRDFAETDWSLFAEDTDIGATDIGAGRVSKSVWEGDLPSDTPVDLDMTSQELVDELLRIKNHPVAPSPSARRKRAAYLKELQDRRDRDEGVEPPEETDPDKPEPEPEPSPRPTPKKRRTTTYTLPNGEVVKRTSQRATYTHVVVIEPATQEARRVARTRVAEERDLRADRYEAAVTTAEIVKVDRRLGIDPEAFHAFEYKLKGTEEPYTGRGQRGSYLAVDVRGNAAGESETNRQFLPEGIEVLRDGDRNDTVIVRSRDLLLARGREAVERLRQEAETARLEAEQPDDEPPGVLRWSSSRNLAEKATAEFEHENRLWGRTIRVDAVDPPPEDEAPTPPPPADSLQERYSSVMADMEAFLERTKGMNPEQRRAHAVNRLGELQDAVHMERQILSTDPNRTMEKIDDLSAVARLLGFAKIAIQRNDEDKFSETMISLRDIVRKPMYDGTPWESYRERLIDIRREWEDNLFTDGPPPMEAADRKAHEMMAEILLLAEDKESLSGILDTIMKSIIKLRSEDDQHGHWANDKSDRKLQEVVGSLSGMIYALQNGDAEKWDDKSLAVLNLLSYTEIPGWWDVYGEPFKELRLKWSEILKADEDAVDRNLMDKFGSLTDDQRDPKAVIGAIGMFFKARSRNSNCVLASMAYELRRRGIDAHPKQAEKGRDEGAARRAWFRTSGYDDQTTVDGLKGRQAKARYQITHDHIIAQHPAPSRGTITAAWKGRNFGHIWNWEISEDGTLSFYDAQTGQVIGPSNYYWGEIDWRYVRVARLDNKPLRPEIEVALAPPEDVKKIAALDLVPPMALVEAKQRQDAARQEYGEAEAAYYAEIRVRSASSPQALALLDEKNRLYRVYAAARDEVSALSMSDPIEKLREIGNSIPFLDPQTYK